MVEEEKHPKREPERECDPHPLAVELPELYKPRPVVRGHGRVSGRKRRRVGGVETAPVRHRRRSDERYGHPVVGEEPADASVEVCRVREGAEEECCDRHEESQDDAYESAIESSRCGVRRRGVSRGELSCDHLDTVLQVNPRHIEPEGVAREQRDVLKEITP